jgi:hypothetical protein
VPEFCPWSSSSWVCPAPARRPSAPCWPGASTGTSRMPTIFTAPPMSARCTVAFRSTTRIGCLGSGRSPTRSTDWRTDKQHGVVTCSALKRRYRNIMIGHRPDVRLVYLKGDRALIAKRLVARHGHFMAASLLESQFAALEEPASEERAISIWVGSLRRCSSTKSSPRLPLGK